MSSLVDLFTPIVSAWNAGGLNATIAGPYKDLAPDETPTPYCVMSQVTAQKEGFSDQKEYWDVYVDFKFYDQTFEACGPRVAAFWNVFKSLAATMTTTSGNIIQIDRVSETSGEEDLSMHSITLTCMFRWARNRP